MEQYTRLTWWLKEIEREPRRLGDLAWTWRYIATSWIDDLDDGSRRPLHAELGPLTDLLAAWCDRHGAIDPTPLFQFLRTACAAVQPAVRSHPDGAPQFSPALGPPPDSETVHETLRQALDVSRRLEVFAVTATGDGSSEPQREAMPPDLSPSERRVKEYIDQHPGCGGSEGAHALKMKPSTWRSAFSRLKRELGYRNEGDGTGHFPPE